PHSDGEDEPASGQLIDRYAFPGELPGASARYGRDHGSETNPARPNRNRTHNDPGVEQRHCSMRWNLECESVRKEKAVPAGFLGFACKIDVGVEVFKTVNAVCVAHVAVLRPARSSCTRRESASAQGRHRRRRDGRGVKRKK